jgi:ankyrin repeat protein
VDLLIAKNAEVNTTSKGRTPITPLQFACGRGHVQAVAKLLEADANVNVTYDTQGESFNPLLLTLHAKEIDALAVREAICELLVEHGVSTAESRSDGCSPLICAIDCGMSDFVRLLLEKDQSRLDKVAVRFIFFIFFRNDLLGQWYLFLFSHFLE